MSDPIPPLTQSEAAQYRAEAAAGKMPTLEIIRRYIATIRKSVSSTPAKTETAKKSRVKKTPVDEDQIDFF